MSHTGEVRTNWQRRRQRSPSISRQPGTRPNSAVQSGPRPTREAVVGAKPGELARRDLYVWAYEGQTGQVLTLQMLAVRPVTSPMAMEDSGFDLWMLGGWFKAEKTKDWYLAAEMAPELRAGGQITWAVGQ